MDTKAYDWFRRFMSIGFSIVYSLKGNQNLMSFLVKLIQFSSIYSNKSYWLILSLCPFKVIKECSDVSHDVHKFTTTLKCWKNLKDQSWNFYLQKINIAKNVSLISFVPKWSTIGPKMVFFPQRSFVFNIKKVFFLAVFHNKHLQRCRWILG